MVASLAKRFGDLDLAEESAAEAFATAVERWPADGVPPNPGAWLTTTANRKAIDRIRREHKRVDKHREALMLTDHDPPEPLGVIDDDRLRLIFTCCHPALAMEARVALTLRLVGGLTVPQIAEGFLVQERTMAPAPHPGQGQDRRRRHPVPGAVDAGPPCPHHRRARRAVPRLQRGVPRDGPRHRPGACRPDRLRRSG